MKKTILKSALAFIIIFSLAGCSDTLPTNYADSDVEGNAQTDIASSESLAEDNEIETQSSNPNETKGMIYSSNDHQISENILGVWMVEAKITEGLDNEAQNRSILYLMMSSSRPPVLCFNNDGTGFEEFYSARYSFTWEFIYEDGVKTGVVYRYDHSGEGWLLYLEGVEETTVFSKVAYDGSDSQYGEDFIRTIQAAKRSPYIYAEFNGVTHAPYSEFAYGDNETDEGVISIDGIPINSDEIKKLYVIEASDDFVIKYYGQVLHEASYTIYRYEESFDYYEDKHEISTNQETLKFPEESGLYLLEVAVVWGFDSNNWSEYRYFFKIEVK